MYLAKILYPLGINNNIITALIAAFIVVLLTAVNSDALCVNVPEANLRKGPGTGHQKTWEVFKYMPFKKLAKKGSWYKVKDVDGDEHWIYKKLVTETFRCAVSKKDNVNIRTGPGSSYKKSSFSPAMKYDSFRILSVKGAWLKVKDEFGSTGWIYKKLLWVN